MLLTFPNKESLLRQIQESPLEQTHLIIADYRKLANWNLIPLSNLTVLLGPNSAGKSSVSEALDILNILRDGIRTHDKDERIDNFYGAKRDDGEISIGFSAQFPDITSELKQLTETCLMELNRDWENPNNFFPTLAKYFNDRSFKAHLEQTTYTYIVEDASDEDLNISVFLDGELAATFQSYNVNLQIKFKTKFVNFFNPNASLLKNIFEEDSEFIKIEIIYDGWQSFSKCPTYVYKNHAEQEEPNFIEINDDIFSYLVLFFYAPILTLLKFIRSGSTQDVRSLNSNWTFLDEPIILNQQPLKELPGFSIRRDIEQKGNDDFPTELIKDRINVHLGNYAESESLLSELNRWLGDPGFLETQYRIEIAIKVCIPLEDLANFKSLKENMASSPGRYNLLEFAGKLVLRDKKHRILNFSEVGSGFSQVIPLLVDLIQDHRLVYKQPELHLHPKLQSRIADCFIEAVNSKKRFKNDYRIIETHSEHFVLRLLRRTRDSYEDELFHSSFTLKPNNFSLIYFDSDPDATQIHQIRITNKGEFFDSWPNGFFDERDEDIWGSREQDN